ncbi:hypothetical protein CRM22_007887 [Opisthorchis felineus]|uniref:CUE domain-containing protein n=1 Tax=Opisthorchis felineus TaxID=147828 RepID=A0A4S2LKV8_OPIFE|nr:hypothetical protein CRM22_007887 [Opisthorchis felineus]
MSRLIFPTAFMFIPYLPLGLLLLTVRLFIYPHAMIASFVLTSFGVLKRSVLRVMCLVLGFSVRMKEHKPTLDIQKSIPIVSNHVTLFDHLMICLTQECVTPHPHVFHWKSTYVPLKGESVSELVGRNVQKDLYPLQLFPEKRPTDSPERLLKFDASLLDSLEKVRPIALKVTRPFPVKLVEYPINWFVELLWHLFVPFTVYNIEYLDPVVRLPDENSHDFAARIRETIAQALGLQPAAEEDEEETLAEQPSFEREPIYSTSTSSSPSASPKSSVSTIRSSIPSISSTIQEEYDGLRYRGSRSDSQSPVEYTTPVPPPPLMDEYILDTRTKMFDHLVPTVREVLSEVSITRIRNALIDADGDVDAAIDILVSKEDDDLNESASNRATDLLPVARLRMAAETFHSTSQARQASLLERRTALLTHARQRFVAPDSSE